MTVELHQKLTRQFHQKLTNENWPIYLINVEFWISKWVNLKRKYSGKLGQYSMEFNRGKF